MKSVKNEITKKIVEKIVIHRNTTEDFFSFSIVYRLWVLVGEKVWSESDTQVKLRIINLANEICN